MNKRKILILLLVFTIAVGFTMTSVSSVSAAQKTAKFKDMGHVFKKIGNGDSICFFSAGKYMADWNFDFAIDIRSVSTGSSDYPNKKHALTKAKVKFAKKVKVKYRVNGKIKTKWKNKYTNKTFKAKNTRGTYLGKKYFESEIINYAPNRVGNGWKPYSAVVYYKKI